MVTRVLAARQEDEEIRNSGILYLNEQNMKKEKSCITATLSEYPTHQFQKQKNKISVKKYYSNKDFPSLYNSSRSSYLLYLDLNLNILADLPSLPATVKTAAASSKGAKAEETGTIFF
jgi:hypothetical protein